jgi:hypothetical protein
MAIRGRRPILTNLKAKWLRDGAQWWSTVDPKPEHSDPKQQVDGVMSAR